MDTLLHYAYPAVVTCLTRLFPCIAERMAHKISKDVEFDGSVPTSYGHHLHNTNILKNHRTTDDSETMTLCQLTVKTTIPVIRIFYHFWALPTSNFQPSSMKPAGILAGYHDNTDDDTPRAKDTTDTYIDATPDPCQIWKKKPERTVERRQKINNAVEHKWARVDPPGWSSYHTGSCRHFMI
ncbi:hypothetical protein Tco_1440403 [Tanacetum coccineum]